MCCMFTVLVFLGPRFGAILWWLVQPLRWQATFSTWFVPLLGFIFLPWTLLMVVILAPGAMQPGGGYELSGGDLIWIGLAVVLDLMTWFGGGYGNRYQMYEYVPAASNPSIMPPTEAPVKPSEAAAQPEPTQPPAPPASGTGASS
ncbi:MAG: hypothetical protein U0452_13275 [Anaerolineae bacterium]